jgi:hypothetical protein
MNKLYYSISLVTGGFLVFTGLCSPILSVPISFLLVFLFLLQVGLVWMVLRILKNGSPSKYTFDQKFYEDEDLGPFT